MASVAKTISGGFRPTRSETAPEIGSQMKLDTAIAIVTTSDCDWVSPSTCRPKVGV